MNGLMDKCCEKCTHTGETPCKDFVACRTTGPLCHESEECRIKIREAIDNTIYGPKGIRISVGMSTCGLASGAQAVYDRIGEELSKRSLDAKLVEVGCMGSCYAEVIVELTRKGYPTAIYSDVTPAKIAGILDTYLAGDAGGALALRSRAAKMSGEETTPLLEELNFFKHQKRRVLKNCGVIDPESIEEYIIHGGYRALSRVLAGMTPEAVIAEVTASGLRGRGGAGFPTGLKWKICNQVPGETKYVICNADEGDPGAFMNRLTVEGDPHKVLEGLMIAGYATGASEGYIFVRAEKPLMAERLKTAIAQARKHGLLGKSILGSKFSFDVKLMLSAGAFVCGEETALIAAIEGKRAMPRPRPPFPATHGLWGKPTTINNVETLAHIPLILSEGAKEYAGVGSEKSKGTKVYCLAGKVERTGAAEVPVGTTIRRLVFDIGGGVPSGKKFKAIQIGGPSGGCLPEKFLDLPLDYESLQSAGAIMGSGGIVIIDEDTCIVDLAKYFLNFTTAESCGKCSPCRIGLQRMLEIITRITEGKGSEGDLADLRDISAAVADSSLCALGRTAPNPVLSTMKYFPEEYHAHVDGKICPAHACAAMIKGYRVETDICKCCGLCAKKCPTGSISLRPAGKDPGKASIDPTKCIRCGQCINECAFGAIKEEW
ncbi:MAG: NADH-quinone oxidoreductase subunit NuoF [Candidatus Bathyarchaeota archaeon]|nr:NADH-quinone oxidoreductase subunit NuoF [Candidatus Bathyarchaeota archaeon]